MVCVGLDYFQFQSGAVKRVERNIGELFMLIFNSKVVRLKDVKNNLGKRALLIFNSKVVRLKVSRQTKPFRLDSFFNSKVVRLKGVQFRHKKSLSRFQFQIGAVKRRQR